MIKGTHAINKFNPATALLRAGILASMKLNVFKVPESLKWSYATKTYAASKGMDMSKFDRLRAIHNKLETIFYAAGGKPENLKKAMLTGNGNRNHEVAGIYGMDERTPLAAMLGVIYQDEFINGLEGLGDLGDPATATSLAAASAAMGTIAALIHSLGPLFPLKKKGNIPAPGQDQESDPNAPTDSDIKDRPLIDPRGPGHGKEIDETIDTEEPETQMQTPSDDNTDSLPEPADEETEDKSAGDANSDLDDNAVTQDDSEGEVSGLLPAPIESIKDFYDKHKTWVRPAAVVAGLVTAAMVIKHFTSKPKTARSQALINQPGINGIEDQKRKQKKKGGKRLKGPGKQSVIALM